MSRAASGLPPIVRTRRPKANRSSSAQQARNATAATITGQGTSPKARPSPSSVKFEVQSTLTDWLSASTSAVPRAPSIIASVAMNGTMRSTQTVKALTAPAASPVKSPAGSATSSPQGLR